MGENLPSSRREAKRLGYNHYFTGKPCKYDHVTRRFVSNGDCLECSRASGQKWRESNREHHRDYSRRWHWNNRERATKVNRQWYWNNRERALERHRQWRKANPEILRAVDAKRRAAKLNATPPWLTDEDHQAIREIYESCPEGYHVDHIIPLQGDDVCGLHVPSNLQHLSAEENLRKSNQLTHTEE